MASRFKLAFRNVFKSLHQMWLEIVGSLFFFFAVAFGYFAIKEYRDYTAPAELPYGMLGSAAMSLVTLVFGVHSFWKARKIR